MPNKRQETFHNFQITTADGKVDAQQYRSDKQLKEAEVEAAKTGAVLETTKSQTFLITEATSWDEAAEIVPIEAVRLEMFNYGLTLGQHNVKRDLMKDADWEPVEGAYDLINDVQTEKQRRVADPASAARKSIRAMFAKISPGAPEPSDEEINAMLQMFMKKSIMGTDVTPENAMQVG